MRPLGLAALLALTLGSATAAAQGNRKIVAGDSSTWLGLSGQLRLRGESWSGFGAGAPVGVTHDDVFGLSRILLRGEAHLRGRFSVVGELKSSLATLRSLPGGRRPSDEDVFDVQQLYAELSGTAGRSHASLRAGRFDIALGRERLVSPLDWTNSRRAFQGVGAHAVRGPLDVQAFWITPITMRRRQPDIPDSTRRLYGVQVGHTAANLRVEAYWLRNETRTASFNGTVGPERRHTLGYRIVRRPSARHADLDVEMAWQTGSLGASRVEAWMVATQLGWSAGGQQSPRVYLGFDAASGDHAAGGDVNTFNQLYPLSHAYLGYADVHGRQNIIDASIGTSMQPVRAFTLQVDEHTFYRASGNDGLYAVDGTVSRAPGTGLSTRVGEEIDLTVRHAFAGGRVNVQGGASRYFAGPFLRQSGPAENTSWIYLQTTASF